MGAKINILAIDDDPGILYTFKAMAELESWKVKGITDPVEGIKFAVNEDFDIILLDYHMPDVNGIEVLKKIREKDEVIPIIILTIDERYEISKMFLEAGANDYALKPIKTADLISRIKAHLNKNIQSSNVADFDKKSLPKGLSMTTLKKIYAKMREKKEFITLEKISDETEISYQTVHRYLDFLEKEGFVSVEMEYGNVGRPTKKFKLK